MSSIEEYPVFRLGKKSTIYKNGPELIKIFKNIFPALQDQIRFNMFVDELCKANVIMPEHLHFDENFNINGYYMPFIDSENGSIFCFQSDTVPFHKKIEYIKELTTALQDLHNHLIVGDIHLDNILISDDHAYLTDLDYAIPRNFNRYPLTKFNILNEKLLPIKDSITTDINKLFLSILSILYSINIELYAYHRCIGTNTLTTNLLHESCNNGFLLDYAEKLRISENEAVSDNYFNIPSNVDIEKEVVESRDALIRNLTK